MGDFKNSAELGLPRRSNEAVYDVRASSVLHKSVVNGKKKTPSFAREISRYPVNSEIIICTGSKAWSRAKNQGWFSRSPKILLPLGDSPSDYRWPVFKRHVMIWVCGQSEPWDRLMELSKQVLQAGAIWILLIDPSRPMVKIEGGANGQ